MAGPYQGIDQDGVGNAVNLPQGPGMAEFLLQGGQVGVNFPGMGFMGVQKNRSDSLLLITFRQLIHGWRRHPAVWSGEAAKFNNSGEMPGPDGAQAGFLLILLTPEGKIRGRCSEGWALVKAQPGLKLLGEKRVIVVAGNLIYHKFLLFGVLTIEIRSGIKFISPAVNHPFFPESCSLHRLNIPR